MLLALLGVGNLLPGTTAQTERRLAIGVYRGPGPWGAALISEYERRMGVAVDYVLDYQDVDTWENQTWPSWQAEAWQQAKRTVVLGGSGVFPVGGSWTAAARGDYDKYWQKLGERLVATGQAAAILRGAHEFNGDWFHYKVTPADAPNFIAAWRRWVGIMRAVPGQKFTFDWNPIVGVEQLARPEDAYPGDQWVDRVALDVYDGYYERGWDPKTDAPPSDAEREAVWDKILNGERGLVFWRNFASQRSKPLSIPEWGLRDWTESDGKSHGGGDNPTFISRMNALILDPAWNVVYHAPWEDPGYGLSDPDDHPKRVHSVAASRQRYLSLTWRSGPAAAPVPSPAPAGAKAAAAAESAAVPSRSSRTTTPPKSAPTTVARSVSGGSLAFALGSTPGDVGGLTWKDLRSPQLESNGYLVCDRSAAFAPAAPTSIAPVLGCGVYQNPLDVSVKDLANGEYDVFLTVWENDYPEKYSIMLQGSTVVTDRDSVGAGSWARLGPFRVKVTAGVLKLESRGWLSNLSGIELQAIKPAVTAKTTKKPTATTVKRPAKTPPTTVAKNAAKRAA